MNLGYLKKAHDFFSKQKTKVIDAQKLHELLIQVLGDEYDQKRAYKATHYLKQKGFLLGLRKDKYLLKKPETQLPEGDILETHYWKFLKEHCEKYCGNLRYIGDMKALELHHGNGDILDEIQITNPNKQSLEIVIFEKKVQFRKYKSQRYDFKKIMKRTQIAKIKGTSLHIACPELAILECLYNTPFQLKGYIHTLIQKRLKKNKKQINYEVFSGMLKMQKFHSSMNTLLTLAAKTDPDIQKNIKEIIKKYGYML